MLDKIKWKKLKNIICDIAKRNVEIIVSTTIHENINAVTDKKDIIINGNNIKSVKMVIRSIAHELVHIIDNLNDGTKSFKKKWNDYEKIIKRKYMSNPVT
jgi:Zn-dependent peptidase ImmA (M78 family)